MIWEDTSTRSRGNENAPATMWTATNKHLSVTVMNAHRYYPGKWAMTCHVLGIDAYEMKIPDESTPEDAQEVAIKICRKQLTNMLNSLPAEL